MLLSGKEVARSVYDAIKQDYAERNYTISPKLVIIQVGDNPASSLYVRNKIRAVSAMGFVAEHQVFSATTSCADVRAFIHQCNTEPSIHGILLQLPLPPALKPQTYALVEAIAAEKDVDGLTTKSLGQLASNALHYENHIPCTALAVVKLLEFAKVPIQGSHVVIVGASNIVGKPCAMALLSMRATVSVCHSKTTDLASFVKQADILIVAIGNPHVIQPEWLHKEQVVIDVGINHDDDGAIIGDIPYAARDIVKVLTPVPGGVGPMTVACLVHNLYHLYQQSYEKDATI